MTTFNVLAFTVCALFLVAVYVLFTYANSIGA